MVREHLRHFALGGALLALACASSSGDGVSGVSGEASITQSTWNYRPNGSDSTAVFLVVVDDAPTPEGRELRQFVAEDIKGFFDARDERDCGRDTDPAAWRPADIHVVIASPTDPARTLTSESHPELLFTTPNATGPELERWEKNLGDAIAAFENPDGGELRALQEVQVWANMIANRATPRSDTERRFLATLPGAATTGERTVTFIATTRDDQSPGPAESYAPPRPLYPAGLFWTPAEIADCSGFAPPPERFAILSPTWRYGHCDDAGLFSPDWWVDCFSVCWDREPVVREDGSAACRVLARAPALDVCPAWAGWSDPADDSGERGPRVEQTEYGEMRVCEVLQLTGEALTACTTDPECEGCQAGFCFAAASAPGDSCADWQGVRFTYGSDGIPGASFEMTCDLVGPT